MFSLFFFSFNWRQKYFSLNHISFWNNDVWLLFGYKLRTTLEHKTSKECCFNMNILTIYSANISVQLFRDVKWIILEFTFREKILIKMPWTLTFSSLIKIRKIVFGIIMCVIIFSCTLFSWCTCVLYSQHSITPHLSLSLSPSLSLSISLYLSLSLSLSLSISLSLYVYIYFSLYCVSMGIFVLVYLY